ncbi:hypothetical protein MOSE0_M07338 [Monosporozyma servazzii]
MLMYTVEAFSYTFQLVSRIVRLAGLIGLLFFGGVVAMFYLIDVLLYTFRLGRYYYEYLLYFNERNQPMMLLNNQKHRHQYYTQTITNNHQTLMEKEIEIATQVNDMDMDAQSNKVNPSLKLLRSTLKKYYTEFFNH